MSLAIQILAWLAVAYVLTSAYEHFGHRLMMHRRMQGLGEFFEKHVLHHGRFAPWAKYRTADDPAGEWVGVDLGAPMMFFATSIIWGPLAFYSRTGAIVLAVFFSLHGEAWTWFHREIHYPRGRWFANTAYFRFVMRYHGQHHKRQGVNFTVMCPGMDFVMGTFGGLLPVEEERRAKPRRRAGFIVIASIALLRCVSAQLPRFPYTACLYDRGGARGLFVTGMVVGEDDNRGLRFRYDDPAWGDHDDKSDPSHGFVWVAENDPQRVVRRQCQAVSPLRGAEASQPLGAPQLQREKK